MPGRYSDGGWGSGGDPNEGRASDLDESWADIPVWGWLSGASARRDMAHNRGEANRATREWLRLLNEHQPSIADLAVGYGGEEDTDEYGDLIGGPSQFEDYQVESDGYQDAALEALRQLSASGGYTDADRTMSADLRRAAAMERGQQLRGANEAALQQSYARGMGAGGGELASRLAGSQAMAQGQAGYDASVNAATQQAAMQRALAAMQGMGALGTQRQANLAQQEMARRGALDAYNQQNMDWRRGRETRNTAWANRRGESWSQAHQQQYENLERGVAGLTGQYAGNQSNRNASGARQDAANQAGASFLAGLAEGIF